VKQPNFGIKSFFGTFRPRLVRLFQSRIGRRLGLAVGLAITLIGGGGLSWMFQRTGDVHDATLTQVLEAMAAAIASSFTHYDARLGGHAINEIAAELAPEARSIDMEVFDHTGTIRWSTRADRVGRTVDAQVRERVVGSSADLPALPPTHRVIPLFKRASCLPCHNQSADPIGGLALAADERRFAGGRVDVETVATIALLLGIAALTFLVLFLTQRTVIEPLSALAQTMARVEEGDYFARAEVQSRDEIGVLASSFNTLVAKITDLRVERIDSDREMRGVRAELELKAELAKKTLLLEERVEQLSFLYALGRELARDLDPDPVLERLADLVVSQLGVPEFAVLLFEDGGFARVHGARGFPADAVADAARSFKLEGSVSAEAAAQKAPIYVPDLASDPRKISFRTSAGDRGSLFCVPVTYQEQVLGTLNFSSPQIDAFDAGRRELLVATGQQAALALANAQRYRKTLALTRTDGLTGLANRGALETKINTEWLARERHGDALSVVLIDVDHFDLYNQTHGHLQADDVLRRVAHLLGASLRAADEIGRYTGQSFLVLLPRTDSAQALQVAEKLRRSIEQADFDRGFEQPLARVTVSCGVATAPGDAGSIPELLHAVDEALYRAKTEGRNRVATVG